MLYPEIRFAEIHQDDLDLAAVVAVDGPRSVEHRHPVPGGETRARPHLPFKPRRDLQAQTRGHQRALSRLQDELRVQERAEVGAGRALGLVFRDGLAARAEYRRLHRRYRTSAARHSARSAARSRARRAIRRPGK